MTTRALRGLLVAAGVAWLAVAGYGLRDVVSGSDDGWQLTYALYSIALVVGGALTLAAAAQVSAGSQRPRLRTGGLVVGGLGCIFAVIAAWAVPVWMTLLGVGLALVASTTDAAHRRGLVLSAGGQLLGIVVLIALIQAEVGRVDEYGDYPAAGGIALIVVAAAAIAGLAALGRDQGRQPAGLARG